MKKPIAIVREVRLVANQPIMRSALSLFGSTVITSVLGFIFWIVANHLFDPTNIGIASAVISTGQFIGAVALVGLGTLTIAEFSSSTSEARGLLSATSILTAILGLCGGLIVGLVIPIFSLTLKPGFEGIPRLAVFATLCGGTTLCLLLDDAVVGLQRGNVQLRRNAIFSAGKLLLLVPLASLWAASGGTQIVIAWLGGLTISVLVLARSYKAAAPSGSWKPDFRRLLRLRRIIYAHHWLNVSTVVPSLLFPVIVAGLVSPAANAAFYSAMLVVGFVNAIPNSLSTALFALGPGDRISLRREIIRSLRISAVVSLSSGLIFVFGSRFILEIFHKEYASAAAAMAILGWITFPASIRSLYAVVARVQGTMKQAAVLTTVGAGVEIASVVLGALTDGVTGVAIGLLASVVAQAIVFAPVIVRACSTEKVARFGSHGA